MKNVLLIVSFCANILLLILYHHSRWSYHKLMNKSLKEEKKKDELVDNVVYDTLKFEKTNEFTQSEYFVTWSKLLKNENLHKILEENNIDLLFYPHPAMQKYIDNFQTSCDKIKIASASEYDMQKLLMESAVLVTDYSSIYFDFAYMKKPLVYYQFDYEKYRKGQYQEGYFSYDKDGFGKIAKDENQLVDELEQIIGRGLIIEDIYLKRSESFFEFHDQSNCERTFEAISSY